METSRPGWIGTAPTTSQSVAVLWVGIVAIMIAGLQPQLLGALELEGRLTPSQIGHASTAELLGMGLAAAAAGVWLKPERLRWIGLIAGLALAAIDVATTRLTGEAITLARGLAGAPSGVLMWITLSLIARSPRPERWSGVYLTVQTLVQFMVATALTAWVMGKSGANGGWLTLAALSVSAALAAFGCPARLARLEHAHGPGGLPPARGLVALGAAFLMLAFIIGVWVYAEPLSKQAGHAPSVVGTAVSVSLACQVLGGAAATVLASRISWFWTLVVCAVAEAALLAVFASLPGPGLFIAASGLFGFVWLFLTPFLVPVVIEADPSRRAAVLMGGAQLAGGSLGPLMASAVVTEADARGALAFGAVCLAAAMAIITALHLTSRHARLTAAES